MAPPPLEKGQAVRYYYSGSANLFAFEGMGRVPGPDGLQQARRGCAPDAECKWRVVRGDERRNVEAGGVSRRARKRYQTFRPQHRAASLRAPAPRLPNYA